jgi:DNA topoisomerase-1
MPNLVYTTDTAPGLRRRRAGKGYAYLDAEGRAVRDQETIARIRKLAIPPAYTDVWICADARGHLQATGRDARGRKQYRYHLDWQAERGARKYDRTIAFAEALPRLRRIIRADLALPGFPRQKVIALVVALLGQTLLRVGNASYEKQNRSYGITTLRSAHARFVAGGQVRFAFRGKGGLQLESTVNDQRLVRLVRRIQQLPGQALFQYQEAGEVQQVTSGDVNDYLQAHLGGPFTAKDFRTWGATVFAFRQLALQEPPDTDDTALANRIRQEVLRDTAAILGNTPRICEKCYVDPRIFDGFADGRVRKAAGNARGPRQWELAAIRYLKRMRKSG